MELSVNGHGTVSYHRILSEEFTVLFQAANVRRQPTGIHAKLLIGLNTTMLEQTTQNIERGPDRVWLTNRAWAKLPTGLKQSFPKDHLDHEFAIFCSQIWDTLLEAEAPTMVDGGATEEMAPWYLKPFVQQGCGTIIYGPPGRGKSYSAQLMAVSADAGVSGLWPCEQTKAMYVNLERSGGGIRRRLGCINTALGLDPSRPLLIQNARGKSLWDVRDSLARAIEKWQVGVVFLDSISRAGLGDLNENRTVNAIVDCLNNLCETWVALAHTPRQDETHVYGGIHFDAGADIMVQLHTQRKTDTQLGIGLEITKANDIAPQPMGMYLYEFDDYGLSLARVATARDVPEIAAAKRTSITDKIIEYLLNVGSADANEIAQELGTSRPYVNSILRVEPQFQAQGRKNKKMLYSVKGEEPF